MGAPRRSCAFALLGLGACICALVAACAGASPTPGVVAAQRLSIAGQDEALPLMRELAETFAHGRAITLSVESASPESSLGALAGGTIDVAVLSAPPVTRTQPLSFTEIARLPIVVLVPSGNPIRNLTLDALGDIYTGRTTEWKDLGGHASPVLVLSREQSSPIRARMDAALIASDSRLTPNALILPSNEAMAVSIVRRPEAIGYITGIQSVSGAKSITIDGQQPSDLARGRYYPLWLSVVIGSKAQPAGAAAGFLAYVKGRQGQRIIAQWGCGPGGGQQ